MAGDDNGSNRVPDSHSDGIGRVTATTTATAGC
jgi:hypothetical protein